MVAMTSKPAWAALTAVKSPNPLEQPEISTFLRVFGVIFSFSMSLKVEKSAEKSSKNAFSEIKISRF
jgi:hypothetical protein